MSNLSGASNSSSTTRPRGRFFGVAKKCCCGESIVELISKSESNPYRRYYRCSYAVSKKLRNDNHTFKWVDEAYLDEIESLDVRVASLEEHCKEVKSNELEKMMLEKILMEHEKEMFEKVEDVLAEAKSEMKKMMIILVFGCMLVVGFIQLL